MKHNIDNVDNVDNVDSVENVENVENVEIVDNIDNTDIADNAVALSSQYESNIWQWLTKSQKTSPTDSLFNMDPRDARASKCFSKKNERRKIG